MPTPTAPPPGPCPTGGEFIYFYEDKEKKIQKYDLNGNLVCEWTLTGSNEQAFAVDPVQGRLYTVWAGGTQIGQYDLTGAELEPLGEVECLTANPGFRDTTALKSRVDSQGNLIVMLAASYSSKGLLKCDPEGNFVALSQGLNNIADYAVDPQGNIWAISVVADIFSESRLVVLSGETMEALATFDIPGLRGITIDQQGNVFVTQYVDDITGDHKVLKLDAQGNILAEWGKGSGEEQGQFNRPEMIATDSQGNIYVYNANWRLVKLNTGGEFIAVLDMSEWLQHGMTIVTEPFVLNAFPPEVITKLLEQRPWAPRDIGLLNPSVYPGSEALPAEGPERAEEQVALLLRQYLSVEFDGAEEKIQAGMDIFNSDAARQKIPHPSLRAGLVGLLNTFAEPAIETILSAQNSRGKPLFVQAEFGKLEPNVVATVLPAGDEQFRIVFNEAFRAENPFLFTRTFAHEPLHQDDTNGVYEEGLITALDTLVYLHQLARHPELASEGSWLARFHNTNALARLNSGVGAQLGLLAANGNRPILPGSTVDFVSFWDRYRDNPTFEATPGNRLLQAYLERIGALDAETCPGTQFDETLLACLDQHQGVVSPEELLAAAQALRLDTGSP
ncbi:MAG: hypothetical protein DPW18_00505 [Chloroflexi bacterium]|nr:hypothetical protein [Chloroflexota bacterium]MDL1941290.1 hypothetical protein [Chloroflexi bacterium CFX2]